MTVPKTNAVRYRGRRKKKMLLEQPLTSEDWYYSAYRLAIGASDAVTRFMFFYSILLLLCNDKQEKVDKYIRRHQPAVTLISRRDGNNDTIFTHLRNAVG